MAGKHKISTTLTLDDLYRPTTVTDANGEDWSRSYDPVATCCDHRSARRSHRLHLRRCRAPTTTTDPLGGEFETVYDEVSRVVQEVDALGNTTGYAYDVLDRVVSVTDPAGEDEQYGYDPLGNVTEAIDRRGNSTTYVYDVASQLLSWAGPEGTGGEFGYDSRGNPVTDTDALDRTVTTTYDALNRPVSQADALGNTTAVSYDPMGRVATSTDGNGNVTVFDYDLAGRLVSSVDPLGNATAYGHDLLGRPTSMLDASGVRTVYGYDPLGQLTAVTEGYQVGPGTAPDINVTTSYAYTEVGNVATITDPKGAITSFLYDELGRTIQETNPLGKVWQYDYDALSRLTTEQDAKGQTTAYQYTPRSDVAVIDYASGANTTFLYDAAQNLIGMTDNLGASGWVYDNAGRLTQQTDSNGNVLGYGYDTTGARTELTLPTGTIGYEYDEAGRPIRQNSPWGALGYAYDSAGNMTDVLRSTGVTSEYGYDADNRITGITHTSPGSELGCDLGANDLEVGVDIETLIDLELCLTVDIDVPILTGLDYGDSIDLDYGYDEVGNVTSQTRKDGSATPVTTNYGYDNLHRLKTSSTTTGVNNTYTYDKASNRTKWVTNHAPDTNGSLTVNATYNAAGQLTSEAKTRPGLLGIPATVTTNHTYDNNGNRTRTQTGAAITNYTYTPDDRLAEIDQGLREVEYEYDGLGRGLTEEVTSLLVLTDQTEQLWDGMVVVGQDSTAFGDTSLVRDVTGDVAIQASDALLGTTDKRWGLTDRLGSTIGQGQGSKIGQLAKYSDWGVLLPGTLGWDSDTGYTGELGDTTTGLWNFYARNYDPMAATWLQADPYRGTLTDPETLSRYGYVGNNPTTASDAFGFVKQQRMQTITAGKAFGSSTKMKGNDSKGKPSAPGPIASSDPPDRHSDW